MRTPRFLMMMAAVALSWAGARADDAPADAYSPRPSWKVGDVWVVETVTDKIQGREEKAASRPEGIRWQFKVAATEMIDGHDCFRIDITCLAKGKVGQKTSMLCDSKTLMLREWRTEVAVAGSYRVIRESYDASAGPTAPVLAPLNALPIDLPAFLPAGAKATPGASAKGTFTYVSQPLAAGAKDPEAIRFSHQVSQQVGPPASKSLEKLPAGFAKALPQGPVTEVKLADPDKSVTQLWQEGVPWPVYSSNGRTEARLVSVGAPE